MVWPKVTKVTLFDVKRSLNQLDKYGSSFSQDSIIAVLRALVSFSGGSLINTRTVTVAHDRLR